MPVAYTESIMTTEEAVVVHQQGHADLGSESDLSWELNGGREGETWGVSQNLRQNSSSLLEI